MWSIDNDTFEAARAFLRLNSLMTTGIYIKGCIHRTMVTKNILCQLDVKRIDNVVLALQNVCLYMAYRTFQSLA